MIDDWIEGRLGEEKFLGNFMFLEQIKMFVAVIPVLFDEMKTVRLEPLEATWRLRLEIIDILIFKLNSLGK